MATSILLTEKENTAKRVLVTGGAGLVGEALTRQLLEKGYHVKALFHSKPLALSHPLLEIAQCDILDVMRLDEVMEGITHVYHCAAIVSYASIDSHEVLKINVEGTVNLVNACINAGVDKLVHVSSVAALGRVAEGAMVTEEIEWSEEDNNSIYGKSKYLGELEVWRGIGEGLQAVIVNPTIILGGNNWDSGSAAIFKTAYNEFEWYTGGVTGFVDVNDVAQAMILLMNSKITAQRFILNGENLPYRQVFSTIANCFGKAPPHKKVTPFLAAIIWRWEAIKSKITGKKHLLTKETTEIAQSRVYFANNKILRILPFFQFKKIEETIENTCEEIKAKYQL